MDKFIRITQTYYVDAIINIGDGESEKSIEKRIISHINESGGVEGVITQGGEIGFSILQKDAPTEDDYLTYECIE